MTTKTLYHVTDASNVDSIMTDGLKPGAAGDIYFTDNHDDAAFLGAEYPMIEEPVVIEAEVMECHISEGPGDAGDIEEFIKSTTVYPRDLQVAN